MCWPTDRIKNWQHFVKTLEDFNLTNYPAQVSHLFRGQSDSCWSLEPSLLRTARSHNLPQEEIVSLERIAVNQFRMQASFYADTATQYLTQLQGISISYLQQNPPLSDLFWWALMQHYGAPTRLLDWTKSPYIAAYFATNEKFESDGAIWVFAAGDLQKFILEEGIWLPNSRKFKSMHIRQPALLPGRMIAQQGWLTFSDQVWADHARFIHEAITTQRCTEEHKLHRKLVIPSHLKRDFRYELHKLGITAALLFPGIDGLGKSIRELIDMEAVAISIHSKGGHQNHANEHEAR